MEAAPAVVEEAQGVEQHRRRESVALHAAVHLGLRLAQVGKAGLLVLVGQCAEILHALAAGGVLGVDAEPVGDQLVESVELEILPLDVLHVFVKVVQRRTDYGAKAAVDVGLGVGVVVEIHIEARGDAGGEVFENAEPGEDVQHLRRDLRLVGEDLLVEPVV